jgi:hypothetical protein
MDMVRITAGGFEFTARFEPEAPATVAAFRRMLPYQNRIIHVRWSGEACWIPMGNFDVGGLSAENATCYPAPGHILLYPGGVSETEILIAYGPSHFASKAGPLAGNHMLTITEGLENLATLGRSTLWEGAKPISFEALPNVAV